MRRLYTPVYQVPYLKYLCNGHSNTAEKQFENSREGGSELAEVQFENEFELIESKSDCKKREVHKYV